jgi:hypothetical protein
MKDSSQPMQLDLVKRRPFLKVFCAFKLSGLAELVEVRAQQFLFLKLQELRRNRL